MLYVAGGQEVRRSDDHGATWTSLGAVAPPLEISGLALDPANPDRVYVSVFGGGVYVWEQ